MPPWVPVHNLWRAEGREVLSFTKLFPRFFTFLPGIPGFCQVIPSFCDVWVKDYFWRKEKCDKTCFLFQKISFVNKNGGFQGHFNGLQRVWHSWHIATSGLKIVKLKHYMQPNKMFWILPFCCIFFVRFWMTDIFKNGLSTQENLSINSRVSIQWIVALV